MIDFRKTAAIGLAIATFSTGILATAAPAAAYYDRHDIVGWSLGATAASLALGAAIAATAAPYTYGYSCVVSRPVFDRYGNIIGYRPARAC